MFLYLLYVSKFWNLQIFTFLGNKIKTIKIENREIITSIVKAKPGPDRIRTISAGSDPDINRRIGSGHKLQAVTVYEKEGTVFLYTSTSATFVNLPSGP